MSVVRKTIAQDNDSPLEFIFSDASVDAYDDSIDPSGWVLDDFKRNPIALLGHNPDFPIGRWVNVRVEGGKLRGHLQLAPEGTSNRIDEVRKLVFAGILKSCSVGFHPIDSMPRPGSKRGGTRYLQQRLVECSVCSVPANANALMLEARGLGVSAGVIRAIFKQSTDASLAERQAHARASLARARALLARPSATSKTKPPVGLIGMSAETKALYARAKGSRQRAAAVLKGHKPRAQRWSADLDLDLQFGGRPIFRKKGPYGW
ncbi:HK97 family phage prohead protease [Bradyrhizobium quebecense]|uniref:HK97 family phage prohead protease n=1 Tax=Bradyrhizobium quebecense TaxID=2748629 RepID=A0A973WTE3_9BRAD|nr:HK97 family phage prohead protease [Bradyrhizobium quebecense]UGA45660.1 HK97 family phage prohead protease [Bradyrhizobium quebecense]